MIATKLDANNQKTVYSYDSYNRVTEIQHFYYQLGGYVEDTSQQVNYTYDSGTYGQCVWPRILAHPWPLSLAH